LTGGQARPILCPEQANLPNEQKKEDPDMGYHTGFHAPNGADYLGFRKGRNGTTEVVYDDGVSRRMVWRIAETGVDEVRLADALSHAVGQLRVVPALMTELKKRAIAVERVGG
jgi:hypothetical protein